MANTSTITDQFNGPSLTALWPGSFGGADINGGRGRIPSAMNGASTGFAGIQSPSTVTLDSMFAQIEVAPPNGGATGSIVTALVLSNITTSGSQIRISVNSRTGQIRFENNVGFSDATPTTLTYSATDHAWWRIRISGGSVLYETAPDGRVWTVRRTLATPAWVNSGASQSVLMETQRASGASNFAFVDNFNVLPVDGVVVLAGAGALATVPVRTRRVTATLPGSSGLTVARLRTARGGGPLGGTGALAAVAATTRPGTATLPGTGGLSVVPGRGRPAGATLPGVGGLTVAGARARPGSGALGGLAALTITRTTTRPATAPLPGTAGLSITATVSGPPREVPAASGTATVRPGPAGTARPRPGPSATVRPRPGPSGTATT